ncbi:hypothetical protein ACH4CD_32700 [Streptomyces fungicidicus]|uniref:hypothetical protein n=1 Tax=Streptomyces fungicidicus TaxID=68203 RepID=UPI0037BCFE3A
MAEQPHRPVAVYETYHEAERAVVRAALHGAANGALPGALIGWLFGLVAWVDPLVSAQLVAVCGLTFWAILGAPFGLLLHALQGGRRDFASVRSMEPSRYDVVDEAVTEKAVRLLGGPQTTGVGGRPAYT